MKRYFAIIWGVLIFHSCNSNEKAQQQVTLVPAEVINTQLEDLKTVTNKPDLKTKNGYPFIKLDLTNINHIDKKTANELIHSAHRRFYQYTYSDTITGYEKTVLQSGAEISISEELFQYFVSGILDPINKHLDSDIDFKKAYIETLKNSEVKSRFNETVMDWFDDYRQYLEQN